MKGIAADSLTKFFGAAAAVRNVCFVVRPGEIYGLIGPNGAGKTTTMRMLVGLIAPDQGSVEICGRDLHQDPLRAKSQLGWVTASTGLYGRLTPAETLSYYGRLYGMTRQAIGQRVELLAEQLQIRHLLARRCAQLSSGERQRVSLARAVIHDPPVLVLDEPTAGLDVLASRFVAEFVREARARERAVLFSTHYMTEAELLCDRIGLLHRGQLRCEGTPAGLKEQEGVTSLEEIFLRFNTTAPWAETDES